MMQTTTTWTTTRIEGLGLQPDLQRSPWVGLQPDFPFLIPSLIAAIVAA